MNDFRTELDVLQKVTFSMVYESILKRRPPAAFPLDPYCTSSVMVVHQPIAQLQCSWSGTVFQPADTAGARVRRCTTPTWSSSWAPARRPNPTCWSPSTCPAAGGRPPPSSLAMTSCCAVLLHAPGQACLQQQSETFRRFCAHGPGAVWSSLGVAPTPPIFDLTRERVRSLRRSLADLLKCPEFHPSMRRAIIMALDCAKACVYLHAQLCGL